MLKILKGCLNTIFVLGLVFVVLGVIIAGLLGYVPFLSKHISIFRPVDLGVTSSQEIFNEVVKNAGTEIIAPEGYSRANFKDYTFIHKGKKTFNTTLTESQLSSIFNYHPFFLFIEDAQVKMHQDGTFEYSSKFILENLEAVNNYDPPVWTELSEVLGEVKKRVPSALLKSIPVYVKAKPEYSAEAGIQLNVEDFKLGRIPLPINLLTKNNQQNVFVAVLSELFSSVNVVYAETPGKKLYFNENIRKAIDEFITNGIRKLPNFSIKSFSIKEGKLDFKGTISTILNIIKRNP